VKFLQVKIDELLEELEDFVTRGRNSGSVWIFVECIQDNEN